MHTRRTRHAGSPSTAKIPSSKERSLFVRVIERIWKFHMIYCKLANGFEIRMISGFTTDNKTRRESEL